MDQVVADVRQVVVAELVNARHVEKIRRAQRRLQPR
jgi:hypothetical protein